MSKSLKERSWQEIAWTLAETASYLFTAFYWLSFCVARRRGIPIFDISPYTLEPSTIALTVLVIAGASIFFSRRIIKSLKSFSDRNTKLLEKLLPVALFAVGLVAGGRFDYASYKLQWKMIHEGLNPWGPVQGGMVNAYGPIHNLLAYPYAIWHLAPKVLFCTLAIVVYHILKQRWARKMSTQSLLLICYGPFIFSSIGVYGFMDIVPAVMICIAAAAFYREKYGQSGVFLALATATKFYPALLVAPICAGMLGRKKHLAWITLLVCFALTLAAVFSWAWLTWGESVLTPLGFASERGPSFLTAWRLLPSEWAEHAKTAIIVTIGLLSAQAVMKGTDGEVNIGHLLLSGLCFVFGLYYLGHQQFYIAIYLMLPVAFMEWAEGRIRHSSISIFASFSLLAWLTFTQVSFDLFSEFKPPVLLGLVDFMSVINSLILIGCGFAYASVSSGRITSQGRTEFVTEEKDYAI